jgi:pimeloyl-ACP methyl ester carboxylesterase
MTQPHFECVSANGVNFAYLSQGEGPLALCLHGFPDSADTFRPLMAALAQAGYRAVAPYMRGYAPTEIPPDDRYQTAVLGQDVIALIEALGAEDAVVIGHDWGAAAAYAAAVIAPHRVRRLIAAAVPYGPGLATSLITDPAQQRRSWYMYLLTSPLGEMALAFDNFAFVDRLWADWSPGFHPGVRYMEALKEMFDSPGTALAAASYYKHTFLPELQDPALAALQGSLATAPITMPTLYLHGAQDGCIGAYIAPEPALFTAGLHRSVIPGTGHFLHLEDPAYVNGRILEFLAAHPPG